MNPFGERFGLGGRKFHVHDRDPAFATVVAASETIRADIRTGRYPERATAVRMGDASPHPASCVPARDEPVPNTG